MIKNRSAKRK